MKPRLALTMGDPAGIGPEIILKAAGKPQIFRTCRPVLIGDLAYLKKTQARLRLSRHRFIPYPAVPKSFELPVIDLQNIGNRKNPLGLVSPLAGRVSGEYIQEAVGLALRGEVDGMVTLPIHKLSFERGGWGKRFRGHTEMIAELTGAKKATIMMCYGQLRSIQVRSSPAYVSNKSLTWPPVAERSRAIEPKLLDFPRLSVVARRNRNSKMSPSGSNRREEFDESTR